MRPAHLPFFLAALVFLPGAASLHAEEAKAAVAVLPATHSLAITAISVDGTNLVLKAVIPAGLQSVVLESHPVLDGPWEVAGTLQVEPGAEEVSFRIPKPATPTAFFRLKASRSQGSQEAAPLLSEELQYVTMPALGSVLSENGDAVFHFKGSVDGSDRIVITREGAWWTHVNWDWPHSPVTINGTKWNSKEKNYLTTEGAAKFLPGSFSLESVSLETIQGRDVIALERDNEALVVYLDDTQKDAGTYEFKILFHPIMQEPAKAAVSTPATVKIAAQIDGSDVLKLTATEATWEHKAWGQPSQVTLNGIPWNPQAESVRKNEGTNQFLPSGIDFSTAKITSRKGRDLATMWADKDAVWVRFADNPNGADDYELEISFGR